MLGSTCVRVAVGCWILSGARRSLQLHCVSFGYHDARLSIRAIAVVSGAFAIFFRFAEDASVVSLGEGNTPLYDAPDLLITAGCPN